MPSDKKTVGCKWIFFCIKRNSDDSIPKYKARLVAKGFHQTVDIDYTEIFNLVVKPITIRVLLTLALFYGWTMRQIEVNNAFLHGYLTESMFMDQPSGFKRAGNQGLVCKLKKALYGLKQVARAWYERLSSFLETFGFKTSKVDYSLMIGHTTTSCCYILIYVRDDIILLGSSATNVSKLISSLNSQFSLKDLGKLNYLDIDSLIQLMVIFFLSQSNILSRANMTEAKTIATPMVSGSIVSTFQGESSTDVYLYRSIDEALPYVTLTRPEISYSVNKAC